MKTDILNATGATQVCAGQKAGIEAIIHAMTSMFKADETDAVILLDAENALNCLNCKAALHNIRLTCPSLSIVLINIYNVASRLFIIGGHELASKEGTTQGDIFAMAMYALGIMPLIDGLRSFSVTQAWYADDAQGAGKMLALRNWWDSLNKLGPDFGYFPKASKTFLVAKPSIFETAKKVFTGTGVNIVDGGKLDFWAAIG